MSIAVRTEEGRTEVRELAQSRTIDGIFVRARCFAKQCRGATLYEIRLDGGGEYAALDARSVDHARWLIGGAMAAFASACALRGATQIPTRPL